LSCVHSTIGQPKLTFLSTYFYFLHTVHQIIDPVQLRFVHIGRGSRGVMRNVASFSPQHETQYMPQDAVRRRMTKSQWVSANRGHGQICICINSISI